MRRLVLFVALSFLVGYRPAQAAAVTLLGTCTWTTANGTKTVTATPAVNDLIVIVTGSSGSVSTAVPTDDQSGTYTTIRGENFGGGAHRMMIHIRNSLVSSATSTIYTHAPGTTDGGGLCVLKVTSMTRTGSSAALQSAGQNNQSAGGTPAPVFGATPQSGNPVVGAVMNGSNPAGMTPRSSPAYTERADVGFNTPARGLEVMSIDSGETSATITWGGTSATIFGDIAVELDTSAAVTRRVLMIQQGG